MHKASVQSIFTCTGRSNPLCDEDSGSVLSRVPEDCNAACLQTRSPTGVKIPLILMSYWTRQKYPSTACSSREIYDRHLVQKSRLIVWRDVMYFRFVGPPRRVLLVQLMATWYSTTSVACLHHKITCTGEAIVKLDRRLFQRRQVESARRRLSWRPIQMHLIRFIYRLANIEELTVKCRMSCGIENKYFARQYGGLATSCGHGTEPF
jgi:hypothetical protein